MKFTIFLAIAPAFACNIIDGDRILGKDLAGASTLFAALDPKVEIGAAPVAGVQRVLRPEELVRLARQNGIQLMEPASAVCFERATTPLTAEQILPILRQGLGTLDAEIEILDFSRIGVPQGTLEFPKSSLMPNGMWRGRVLYDQGHSMPIWAKVRISVQRTWVETTDNLAMGKAIEPSQLIVKTGPRFPFEPALMLSLETVVGRRAARTLPSGTPITAAMLTIAHDIERGDMVAVEVRVGAATLAFEAKAEGSGRTGESIIIKNPDNGKAFLAKIQDKGHVLVER
jgi:flagella basal body P-ring formation protein FlgA